MAVSKVYTCDLCGQPRDRAALMRLGVRGLDDRPEDADNIDVGPCCHDLSVGLVLKLAAQRRELVING